MKRLNKCDRCFNHRLILSENGYHYGCTLPDKQAVLCRIGEKDRANLINKKLDGGKDGKAD